VIAPLDANTLAKLSTGLTDNLLTSVARAWDFESKKKIVFAPAMNTKMWEHPVTAPQVYTLLLIDPWIWLDQLVSERPNQLVSMNRCDD
jgi:phosphopantothenoylcysteine synthetase/decarboxylase